MGLVKVCFHDSVSGRQIIVHETREVFQNWAVNNGLDNTHIAVDVTKNRHNKSVGIQENK